MANRSLDKRLGNAESFDIRYYVRVSFSCNNRKDWE